MPQFNLDEYVDVQTRITRFWAQNKDGAIRTSLESPSENFGTCRYKAEVFKDRTSERPDATGYAFEIAGTGMANKTSHEENAETSAIGRALANMGYATSSKDRPSRQEMEKVARHTDAPKPVSKTPSSPAKKDGESYTYKDETFYPDDCTNCGRYTPAKSVSFSQSMFHRTLCFDCQELAKAGELDTTPQTAQQGSDELDNLFKQRAG